MSDASDHAGEDVSVAMRVEGDVGLDVVVWLSHSPEAVAARKLARALDRSEWAIQLGERVRARVRNGVVDLETRTGPHWTGLINGRLYEGGPSADARAFQPHVREMPATPLRLESCWFATDEAGEVACFDRDQLGAAPTKRCWGPRPPPPFAAQDTAARMSPLVGHHAPPHPGARAYSFVTDLERVTAGLVGTPPRGAARRWSLAEDAGRLLVTMAPGGDEALPPAFVGWLHARKLCAGCARSSLQDARVSGLYVYRHQGRDRAAPYERIEEPAIPWNAVTAAHTLGLRLASLQALVLPLRFASKDRLQPIEYAPCTWSDTVPWESEAGVRHGNPVGLRGR